MTPKPLLLKKFDKAKWESPMFPGLVRLPLSLCNGPDKAHGLQLTCPAKYAEARRNWAELLPDKLPMSAQDFCDEARESHAARLRS